MFQISRRTDYAFRVMIELGLTDDEICLSARELARRTAVSQAFLHKITGDLVKASLVRTYAGPTGGLALARVASSITVLHIVEAVEGPICLNVCQLRPRECPRDLICPAHGYWGRLQNQIVGFMQSTTLAELAAEARLLKKKPQRSSDVIYLYDGEASTRTTLSYGIGK